MMQLKIGIIGYGNMGQAIAHRLSEHQVFVFDQDKTKLTGAGHIHTVVSLEELLNNGSDVLILAVKPQDFGGVLDEIKPKLKGQLIISIAAGITAEYIENKLGKVRVVRVMPNLPAKIGEAMSCLCGGKFVDKADMHLAEKLFKNLGQTLIIEKKLMNFATAISGSGPAYVSHFIETNGIDIGYGIPEDKKEKFIGKFIEAAQSGGFKQKEASLLVNATFKGTVDFLKQTNMPAQQLKKQVTSKGGTTEAALKVLAAGGSLIKAVKAAARRAEELSKVSWQ